MHGFKRLASVAVVAAWVAMTPASGMQKYGPELGEILRTLESNLATYDNNVPSFFCDEHAASEMIPGTSRDMKVTDSIFRLKRKVSADQSISLVESREVKMVNSQPATSAELDAPATLDGAFEGALAVVSASQQGCMDYELQRKSHGAYVIGFKTKDDAPKRPDCLLQEKAHGRVLIDPASMQITRLELTTPRHMIRDERWSKWYPSLKSEWVITVDYAPVLLDGISFWMPENISSRVTSDPNTFHSTTWLFKASYKDFHKLEVSSRMVPQ
jgi:hypothetical protein